MKNFRIKCLFCGNYDQDKFQTTMEDDSGYSEYTIMTLGYVEFKCLICGTFGTDDYDRKTYGNNKLNMFEITCAKCNSHGWSSEGSGLSEEQYMKINCNYCDNEEKGD